MPPASPTSNRFVVVAGCSGGGKSSLLAELQRRGYAVVEEPGRRVVREEMGGDGSALPWSDMAAFAKRTIELARTDRATADPSAWTFFDRSLVDGACALEHATGEPLIRRLGELYRYHSAVFFAPPWPEIYVGDAERRHGLEAGRAEAERLFAAYTLLGYKTVTLPKVEIRRRADFVLSYLANPA